MTQEIFLVRHALYAINPKKPHTWQELSWRLTVSSYRQWFLHHSFYFRLYSIMTPFLWKLMNRSAFVWRRTINMTIWMTISKHLLPEVYCDVHKLRIASNNYGVSCLKSDMPVQYIQSSALSSASWTFIYLYVDVLVFLLAVIYEHTNVSILEVIESKPFPILNRLICQCMMAAPSIFVQTFGLSPA